MINSRIFGKTANGEEVVIFEVTNGEYSMSVMNYGATFVSFCGVDKNGNKTDVMLGFDSAEPYFGSVGSMGSAIGRFGNRIEKGKFTLNGKEYTLAVNNGPNHLHGGIVGFSRKLWDYEIVDDNSVMFSLTSPDGEEGYPGNLNVNITYSLSADGALSLDYYAVSDQDTVINLTNHSYFNLNGVAEKSNIDNIELWLDSTAFCEVDNNCLADGNILAVRNTPYDFTAGAKLGERLAADFQQTMSANGIDHNFVLGNVGDYKHFATLYSDKTGIEMKCFTDQPGVQIYTGNFLSKIEGKGGTEYDFRSGICLETQGYPNSTTYKHFPSPVLRKGEIYRRKTVYSLGVRK